jgi:hypothetical protein
MIKNNRREINILHTIIYEFVYERVTLSKIRRAVRPKILIILRIKSEIRPKDRKRGYLGQKLERKRRNRLLMYILFAIAYS